QPVMMQQSQQQFVQPPSYSSGVMVYPSNAPISQQPTFSNQPLQTYPTFIQHPGGPQVYQQTPVYMQQQTKPAVLEVPPPPYDEAAVYTSNSANSSNAGQFQAPPPAFSP